MRKLLLLPFLLALSVPAQANFWDSIMNQEENQEESKIPPEDPAVTPPPPLEATVKALPEGSSSWRSSSWRSSYWRIGRKAFS